MMMVPRIKVGDRLKSSNNQYENIQESTIVIALENVFKMLSAYFMVAAAITPPIA